MNPLPIRESHTGRFALAIAIIIILLGVIAAEIYGFVSLYGFTSANTQGAKTSASSTTTKDVPGTPFEDSIHGLKFTYPLGWTASSSLTSQFDPNFVVGLLQDASDDVQPAYVLVYDYGTTDGMDTFVSSLRQSMTQDGHVIAEDQLASNGSYALSSSKQIKEGGQIWTDVFSELVVPHGNLGGKTAGYVVFDIHDNLDSQPATLDALAASIFPSLEMTK